MNLHTLPAIVDKPKKRIGRGHGSGKVKTGGRGQKGQKARDAVRADYEGGQNSLFHRYPFLRGKGRNHSQNTPVIALTLRQLAEFSSGDTITVASLKEKQLIHDSITKVKIIGSGSFDKALTVKGIAVSKGAKAALEKAGGTIS